MGARRVVSGVSVGRADRFYAYLRVVNEGNHALGYALSLYTCSHAYTNSHPYSLLLHEPANEAQPLPPRELHAVRHGTAVKEHKRTCLLYTSPSPRDGLLSRMPSSA